MTPSRAGSAAALAAALLLFSGAADAARLWNGRIAVDDGAAETDASSIWLLESTVHARARLAGSAFSIGVLNSGPAWSREGRRLAFERNGAIAVVDAAGHGLRRLTSGHSDDFEPTWSPQGWIAFASDRSGNWQIYAMNADGTGVVKLTDDPGADDQAPAWSPDGASIAFHSTREGGGLYLMNADGSEPRRLPVSRLRDEQPPSWSPDGSRLAFARTGSIYTIRLVDNRIRRITSGPFDSGPAWSPDGRWIAFARGSGDVYSRIYLVHPDGTDLRALSARGSFDEDPAWQPLHSHPHGCTIVGTPGADLLTGSLHADHICGLGGNDTLLGSGGNDTLDGGRGDDTLNGGAGRDTLNGGPGDDIVYALDDWRDSIDGGPGRDRARRDPLLDTVRRVESFF
jgi:TolB protein